MRRFLTAICLSLLPLPAAAACSGGKAPVFQCTLKNETKLLELCFDDDQVSYSYGPKSGSPELAFRQPVREVFMRPWNGVGSSIFEVLALSVGEVEYAVHYALNRNIGDGPDASGGVVVTKGDQTLADIQCDSGRVTAAAFYPIFKRKEELGQCWDYNAFEWRKC